MQREYTLNTYAVRKATYGKGLADTGTFNSNHSTLKHLDTLTRTLADLYGNLNGITNLKFRCFFFHAALSNQIKCVHQ